MSSSLFNQLFDTDTIEKMKDLMAFARNKADRRRNRMNEWRYIVVLNTFHSVLRKRLMRRPIKQRHGGGEARVKQLAICQTRSRSLSGKG